MKLVAQFVFFTDNPWVPIIETNNSGHSEMLMRFYICTLNKGTCKYANTLKRIKQGFIYIGTGHGLTCIYMMWIVGNVCFWACKKLVAMVAEIQLVNILLQGIEDLNLKR
jgi:E3 ubiquitin-protein ligase DOA10